MTFAGAAGAAAGYDRPVSEFLYTHQYAKRPMRDVNLFFFFDNCGRDRWNMIPNHIHRHPIQSNSPTTTRSMLWQLTNLCHYRHHLSR